MVNFSFNNPPLDNIAFLMSKKSELHFDYDEIKFEAHQRAFTVAKVTQIDLLADIQTSLENAFVEGQSFEKWKKELKPTLQKHGWLGKVVVQKPNTKEQKEIFVGASRLKKIFYINTRTAYQQSRARAQEQSSDEYLRYVAILDSRTRHTHAQMHGLILKKKDPFWEKNYPPNGWNCRCRVDSYSKDDLDEFGWRESSPAQKLNIAEKDWDYDTRNLEKNDNALQLIIENKLKKYVKNPIAKQELLKTMHLMQEGRKAWAVVNELKKAKKDITMALCAVPKDLQGFFNTKAPALQMSSEQLKKHLDKHDYIKLFDYALAPYLLNNSTLEVWQDENPQNPNKYLLISKFGVWYRMSVKNLNEENEFFFENLLKGEKEKLTHNKKRLWSRNENTM